MERAIDHKTVFWDVRSIASMIGSSTNLCAGATGRVQIQKNDKSRQIASTTLRGFGPTSDIEKRRTS
jgi:hypothetical protein